jgi:hypothetical protein
MTHPPEHYAAVPGTEEAYPYGTQRYALDDGIRVVVGSGDMRRHSVDEWTEVMTQTINTFPHPTHTLLLLDLTHPNQGFTPYSRIKASEIVDNIQPGRTVVIALLFRDSIINNIVMIFMNRIVMMRQSKILFKTFLRREQAVAWLREKRQQLESAYTL